MVRVQRWAVWMLMVACNGGGSKDKNDGSTVGVDADGDGFDSIESGGDDCDDDNAAIYPGAPEVCSDGVDDNCDGLGDDTVMYFRDDDADGFGEPWDGRERACEDKGEGWVTVGGDCLDDDPSVNPDEGQRGRIFLRKGNGVNVEITDQLQGTEDELGTYTLTEEANIRFCPGTFFSSLTISNVGDPASDQKTVVVDSFEYTEADLDAAGLGRLLIVERSAVQVRGLTFRNGAVSAEDDPLGLGGVGGALLVYDDSWIDIVDSAFLDNTATSGGAIGMLGQRSDLKLVGSVLTDNTASEDGGSIYCASSQINLSDSDFTGNTALRGGAFAFRDDAENIDMNNVRVDRNSAEDGGAFYCDAEVNLVTWDSLYTENIAANQGGVAWLSRGLHEQSCQVGDLGGTQGYLDNEAGDGGAFYIESSAELETSGCEWDNEPDDISTSEGGAFEMDSGFWVCDRDGCEAG